MYLFLLLSVPTCFLLALSFFRRLADDSLYQAFVKGFIWYIPVFIFYLLLQDAFPFSYRIFPLYLSYVLEVFLIHHLWIIGGVLLVSWFSSASQQSTFLSLFAFSCGYMTLVNLYDFVVRYPLYTIEVLCFVPIYRLCLILCISILLRDITKSYSKKVLAAGVSSLVIPVIIATGAFFYQINQFVISLCLGIGFSMGSVIYSLVVFTNIRESSIDEIMKAEAEKPTESEFV